MQSLKEEAVPISDMIMQTSLSPTSMPCPFLHDGELGRRDLLRHKYSCVPCLEFKNGFCPQADACGHSLGILEERFHPMLFRTRYCWYMTTCKRQDWSYAHKEEEKSCSICAFSESLRPSKSISTALSIGSFCGTNAGENDQFMTFDGLSGEKVNFTTTNLHNENGLLRTLNCSSITLHSSRWGFSNQPDFSWVYGLVEDDQPNLLEDQN
ncbi:unnamed protein product [Prunus armeniaca]|uniref:Uncharacterized protein n=1 Tax=Prunus armeniaca TaxID=36596 RepID=A0A6J5VBF3_PRUAR|nr:unnamed protein product [Prunus armeniaca]